MKGKIHHFIISFHNGRGGSTSLLWTCLHQSVCRYGRETELPPRLSAAVDIIHVSGANAVARGRRLIEKCLF